MRTGRSEAFDIFHKWFSEKALLRCDLSFPVFAACFRGRIFEMSDDQIKVISDDSFSELAFKVGPNVEFGYGDPRQVPEEADKYECTLIVFLSPLGPTGQPDCIGFTELKEKIK